MKRALVLGLVIALALSACGGDDNGESSTDAPEVVRVLAHSSFLVTPAVLDEFTRQTGYKVETIQPGDAGVTLNEAILRKSDPVADLLFGVDNGFLSRALDEELFESYEAKGTDTVKAGTFTDAEHRVTPIDQGDVCLNYDRTYFGVDGHPPAPSLTSLIDPDYKDLTVVENAATSSPGLLFLLATIAAFPDDTGDMSWQEYWRKLRINGVRVVNDWTEAYQTDFTAGGGPGDRPIVVSYASSPPADVVYSEPKRDEPRVAVVENSCFRQYEFAGVLKNADNPAGARAFIDFMLTKQFQEDMPLSMFVNPVIADAALPEVYAKWAVEPAAPYSIDPADIGENRDEWIEEWTNIVLR
jgi:thiamine transport system substrate-binding protein